MPKHLSQLITMFVSFFVYFFVIVTTTESMKERSNVNDIFGYKKSGHCWQGVDFINIRKWLFSRARWEAFFGKWQTDLAYLKDILERNPESQLLVKLNNDFFKKKPVPQCLFACRKKFGEINPRKVHSTVVNFINVKTYKFFVLMSRFGSFF